MARELKSAAVNNVVQATRCCGNFCKEFQAFALQGNGFDLAIGVVMALAFTNLVQSLVDDVITPPLGLVLSGVDFSNLTIKMKNFVHPTQPPVVVRYGKFIQATISLFLMLFSLFLVIKSMNKLRDMTRKKEASGETEELLVSEDVLTLREIRDLLSLHFPDVTAEKEAVSV